MRKPHVFKLVQAVLVAGVIGLVACGGGGGGDGGAVAPAPAPVLSVFAGALQPATGSRDGIGSAALFNKPGGAAQDAAGNVYVADTGSHTIRKITAQGAVTTLAGAAGQPGNADGSGATARFLSPQGLAIDAAGFVYVSDNGNQTVRKISPAGVVTTVVGTAGQIGSTDGPAGTARLDTPTKVAVDPAGAIYVVTPLAVRKMAPDGSVSTFALLPKPATPFDGVRFTGIAVDAAGNVFIADAPPSGVVEMVGDPGAIRKFSAQGQPLPLGSAADGVLRLGSAENGAVRFGFAVDIAADAVGNLYVARRGVLVSTPRIQSVFRNIQRVAPDGSAVLVAGPASEALPSITVDGPGKAARFLDPRVVSVGPGGRLVVIETETGAVRAIDAQGNVSTLAGGNGTGFKDGEGSAARFSSPQGLAAAPDGGLYVVDSGNASLRKVSAAGVVSTVSAPAPFLSLANVAVGPDGAVYVTSHRFSNFCPDPLYSVLRFVGGGPAYPSLAYNGSESARAVTVDSAGNVVVNELASSTNCGADFNKPTQLTAVTASGRRVLATGIAATALAADAAGRVYFANQGTVGAVNAAGEVEFRVGVAGQAGDQDGMGAGARFRAITALAIDPSGNLYVADGTRIRKITSGGAVTTIADLSKAEDADAAPHSIGGLAWVSGALYATFQHALIRISFAS